jgi:hypothetical protein
VATFFPGLAFLPAGLPLVAFGAGFGDTFGEAALAVLAAGLGEATLATGFGLGEERVARDGEAWALVGFFAIFGDAFRRLATVGDEFFFAAAFGEAAGERGEALTDFLLLAADFAFLGLGFGLAFFLPFALAGFSSLATVLSLTRWSCSFSAFKRMGSCSSNLY